MPLTYIHKHRKKITKRHKKYVSIKICELKIVNLLIGCEHPEGINSHQEAVMATATVAANLESPTVTPTSGGKRLVKSKSGLKIVCQHDRESAPWDMAEPQWTPDKEVSIPNT